MYNSFGFVSYRPTKPTCRTISQPVKTRTHSLTAFLLPFILPEVTNQLRYSFYDGRCMKRLGLGSSGDHSYQL